MTKKDNLVPNPDDNSSCGLIDLVWWNSIFYGEPNSTVKFYTLDNDDNTDK